MGRDMECKAREREAAAHKVVREAAKRRGTQYRFMPLREVATTKGSAESR